MCKRALREVENGLYCGACAHTYQVAGGIPQLFPPADARIIDPSRLRIKSKIEAARTIIEMTRSDSGFVRSQRVFYALYFALAVSLAVGWVWAAGLALVLAADWVVFRLRRGRILRRDLDNPLRLRTTADYHEIDELYARHGERQPGMFDWVALASESTGGSAGPAAAHEAGPVSDDERYRDILRVYSAGSPGPGIVVDVGANDGRAYWRFGIGAGARVIGIDVSRSLLETFRENVPDQTAVQADGGVLPIREGSVDFLFCTETLEHLTNPDAAAAEFVRVLKPGGRLMVQSPNAHRLRNLNVFHMITLVASLVTDRVLQKKTVHENTWHNAVTYHWDFSRQDYRRMFDRRDCRIVDLYSRSFFFPAFLLRGRLDCYRRKERLLSAIPAVKFWGDDLVVVAEKL